MSRAHKLQTMQMQDEKKPFDEKYRAREILEGLLKNDFFIEIKDS